MPKIFISYRRADSITITGRIHDRLATAYGEHNIFKDVDDIPLGVDFRAVLEQEIGQADVLLVIIGPKWLKIRDESGRFRLQNPDDFVRIELETALSANTLIVPILVHEATMPLHVDLPESLRGMIYRNGITVREDPDFSRDIQRLLREIDDLPLSSQPGKKRQLMPLVSVIAALLMAVVFFTFSAQLKRTVADTHVNNDESARRAMLESTTLAINTEYGTGITARLFSLSSTMNIRAGPSAYHDVLVVVHDYETVTVFPGGKAGDWIPVRFGEVDGWFDGSQLSWRPIYGWRIDSPKPTVILRAEPDLNAEKVIDLSDGQLIYFAYTSPANEWAYVVVNEYHAGWLSMQDGTFTELSG